MLSGRLPEIPSLLKDFAHWTLKLNCSLRELESCQRICPRPSPRKLCSSPRKPGSRPPSAIRISTIRVSDLRVSALSSRSVARGLEAAVSVSLGQPGESAPCQRPVTPLWPFHNPLEAALLCSLFHNERRSPPPTEGSHCADRHPDKGTARRLDI